MSDILGVTERTIQNYETGSTRLTIENWVRCIVIVERQIQGADRAINRKSIPKEVAKIVETILEEDC
jgi:predicted transcriptional regulator